MPKTHILFAFVLIFCAASAFAKGPSFAGLWTYRSLFNKHQIVPCTNLTFAQGTFNFTVDKHGVISGVLLGGDHNSPSFKVSIHGQQLAFKTINGEEGLQARFQGVGINGTMSQGWVYDYVGYMVPSWPKGVEQVDAFVGSVIRSVGHGAAPAGLVASFYSVRATF